jgi:glutaredoxin-like protein NrdH
MKLNHVSGKKAADLKLYALSTCPWCKKTKALLDSLGVEYYFVDVDQLSGADRDEAMAIVKKWNPSASFPTIENLKSGRLWAYERRNRNN